MRWTTRQRCIHECYWSYVKTPFSFKFVYLYRWNVKFQAWTLFFLLKGDNFSFGLTDCWFLNRKDYVLKFNFLCDTHCIWDIMQWLLKVMHILNSQIKILEQLLPSSVLNKWEPLGRFERTFLKPWLWSTWTSLGDEFWDAKIKLSFLIQIFNEKENVKKHC